MIRAGDTLAANVGAQRNSAHRLDAAGNADVDRARCDQAGDQVIGLLRRTALAVDGGRAGLPRQSGGEPCGAGDVVGLFAELRDAAADDLLDQQWVDPGAFDKSLLRRAENLGGVQTGQPAPAPADRGADSLDDDRISHDGFPSFCRK